MKSSYHHGNLRQAIHDEALSMIDHEGLAAVSLRGIARRLGVSEAAPYHHYAGKEELLATIAADGYRGLYVAMVEAVEAAGDDPFAALRALGEAYVRFGLAHRGRFRLMFGEHMVDLGLHEDVVTAGRPTRELLAATVQRCLPDHTDHLDLEETTWALVHGITWLVAEGEIRVDADPVSLDHLLSIALDVLVAGLRTTTHPTPGPSVTTEPGRGG